MKATYESSDVLAGQLIGQLNQEEFRLLKAYKRLLHVTIIPHKRHWRFELPEDATRILDLLVYATNRHAIDLYEAAAMPDHVHLLIGFSHGRKLEQDVLKKIKGVSAREFFRPLDMQPGSQFHVWHRSRFFRDISTASQWNNVLQYIQNNPLKEGIETEFKSVIIVLQQSSIWFVQRAIHCLQSGGNC